MVSSVIFRPSTIRQALDHQVNLALEAMARWVRIAFWMSGLGHSNRYARYLVSRMVAGMYVGYIPISVLTPSTGVVVWRE